MKYITLFGEILLFVPVIILIFLVDPHQVSINPKLLSLVDILYRFFPFLTIQQLYVGLIVILVMILNELFGGLIKFLFFKDRPSPMKWKNWYEKILASSFPSLHSTRTFSLFLLALYFTNYYIVFFFFLFWLLISYSRVYLKKHFWVDICGGVLLASFNVFLILYLFG